MKPKHKHFQFDLGLVLLFTGALANITIWIGAFVATEADGPIGAWVRNILLPVLGGISGLSMGITVTAGLVYVLSRLGRLKPRVDQKVRGTKKKYKSIPNVPFYTAWAAVILLLIISPALLAPYVFMIISRSDSIYAVLGDWWARPWSVGRILAADLAMSAVALVYGVQLSENVRANAHARIFADALAGRARPARASRSATPPVAVPARSPKQSPSTASSPSDMRQCDVPNCGIHYKWPQGKGAHYKKYHKDLVIQKGIPAKVSLPLNKQ